MATTDVVLQPSGNCALIADMVGIASELAGHEEIGSIQLVLNRPPALDELVRFRRWADTRGFEILGTTSGVAIRRRWSKGPTKSTASSEAHGLPTVS